MRGKRAKILRKLAIKMDHTGDPVRIHKLYKANKKFWKFLKRLPFIGTKGGYL